MIRKVFSLDIEDVLDASTRLFVAILPGSQRSRH